MGSPSETADRVVALALARPPTLGDGRLVCVDGPAGSGKTTLAAGIAARTGAPVLHMDDLYPGWSGLRAWTWIIEPNSSTIRSASAE